MQKIYKLKYINQNIYILTYYIFLTVFINNNSINVFNSINFKYYRKITNIKNNR